MAHIPSASYPICPLCSEHVELESANTDANGKAVHEDCYVAHIIERADGPLYCLSEILINGNSPRKAPKSEQY